MRLSALQVAGPTVLPCCLRQRVKDKVGWRLVSTMFPISVDPLAKMNTIGRHEPSESSFEVELNCLFSTTAAASKGAATAAAAKERARVKPFMIVAVELSKEG